jgi:hypothetical protein
MGVSHMRQFVDYLKNHVSSFIDNASTGALFNAKDLGLTLCSEQKPDSILEVSFYSSILQELEVYTESIIGNEEEEEEKDWREFDRKVGIAKAAYDKSIDTYIINIIKRYISPLCGIYDLALMYYVQCTDGDVMLLWWDSLSPTRKDNLMKGLNILFGYIQPKYALKEHMYALYDLYPLFICHGVCYQDMIYRSILDDWETRKKREIMKTEPSDRDRRLLSMYFNAQYHHTITLRFFLRSLLRKACLDDIAQMPNPKRRNGSPKEYTKSVEWNKWVCLGAVIDVKDKDGSWVQQERGAVKSYQDISTDILKFIYWRVATML